MSCENLREKLTELKSDLPQDSEDAVLAGKYAHYLEEECERQSTSTSFLLFRHTLGLNLTDKGREEAAKEILDNWKKDAGVLLERHGVKVE